MLKERVKELEFTIECGGVTVGNARDSSDWSDT